MALLIGHNLYLNVMRRRDELLHVALAVAKNGLALGACFNKGLCRIFRALDLTNTATAAARTRLDGDNLVCDADIFLCVRASLRGEREIVSAIDFTAAKPHEKSAYPLSVVYPRGDSLWAVAKANRVSPARLAEINHLTADAAAWRNADLLAGKNALMIEF